MSKYSLQNPIQYKFLYTKVINHQPTYSHKIRRNGMARSQNTTINMTKGCVVFLEHFVRRQNQLFTPKFGTYPLFYHYYWTFYLRIQYSRSLAGTYLPRITRAACTVKKQKFQIDFNTDFKLYIVMIFSCSLISKNFFEYIKSEFFTKFKFFWNAVKM